MPRGPGTRNPYNSRSRRHRLPPHWEPSPTGPGESAKDSCDRLSLEGSNLSLRSRGSDVPAKGSGCLSGSKISEISRRFAAAGRRWWWRHAVPSDLTVSASDCLGITPLGGFRLNRWVPKFPNLKHHVLGLLGGGPLQRRSLKGGDCYCMILTGMG